MDGDKAEQLACKHLKRAGLTIIDRNYRCRRGEIDIVARHNDTLVFVEVRYRRQNRFGSAAESITNSKQARVIHAATHYLQHHQLSEKVSCRFDTICITPQQPGRFRRAHCIEWLENAFQA